MDLSAFAAPLLPLAHRPTRAARVLSHRRAVAAAPPRRPLRMAANDVESSDPPLPATATDIPPPAAPASDPAAPAPAPAPETADGDATSAQSALKLMREDVARENAPRDVQTGVYRDVDGKSNVFAVEPLESVDDKPQTNLAAILAAVFVCVGLALLLLPRLPFTNADQF